MADPLERLCPHPQNERYQANCRRDSAERRNQQCFVQVSFRDQLVEVQSGDFPHFFRDGLGLVAVNASSFQVIGCGQCVERLSTDDKRVTRL